MKRLPRRRAGDRVPWPVPIRVAGVALLLCIGFWIWVVRLVLAH